MRPYLLSDILLSPSLSLVVGIALVCVVWVCGRFMSVSVCVFRSVC